MAMSAPYEYSKWVPTGSTTRSQWRCPGGCGTWLRGKTRPDCHVCTYPGARVNIALDHGRKDAHLRWMASQANK